MFWGLIIESNKKYTQRIKKTFHVSMACLDANKSSAEPVQINVFYENTSYLICSLKKDSVLQMPLDLNFQEGTKISFSCSGNAQVYLTGYLVPDDEEDFNHYEIEDTDGEDIPKLVPLEKKRKANQQKDNLNKAKKSKVEVNEYDDDDNDDDDDDDDDDDEDDDDDDDDEDDDEINSDEIDIDGLNDSDDDEDDEEEDEDDSGEDETELATSQKQKQNQNQSLKQNKKEKNKLSNGTTDDKMEKEQQGKQKKNKENKDNSKTESKSEQQQSPQQPKKRIVEGGVQVEDLKVGTGAPAKSGKFVSVYYIGRLKNGKKFDHTTQGEGFKFKLGKGEVIKGWDVGILGMKVGGKRRITIPPNMGYGAKGSYPVIPPNSQLNFEVELKNVF